MKPIEKVQAIAQRHGWETTKYQYAIIREIMNEKGLPITEEGCKEICNLQRYARMSLKKDQTALAEERKWHNTPATREVETWDSIFRQSNPLQ